MYIKSEIATQRLYRHDSNNQKSSKVEREYIKCRWSIKSGIKCLYTVQILCLRVWVCGRACPCVVFVCRSQEGCCEFNTPIVYGKKLLWNLVVLYRDCRTSPVTTVLWGGAESELMWERSVLMLRPLDLNDQIH